MCVSGKGEGGGGDGEGGERGGDEGCDVQRCVQSCLVLLHALSLSHLIPYPRLLCIRDLLPPRLHKAQYRLTRPAHEDKTSVEIEVK